jgi:hypothetical protein
MEIAAKPTMQSNANRQKSIGKSSFSMAARLAFVQMRNAMS